MSRKSKVQSSALSLSLEWNDHVRVEKLVAQLSESCETSGFFYLKIEDHFGEKCMQMLNAAKEVFNMPNDEKDKLVNDETSQMHHKGKFGTGWGK